MPDTRDLQDWEKSIIQQAAKDKAPFTGSPTSLLARLRHEGQKRGNAAYSPGFTKQEAATYLKATGAKYDVSAKPATRPMNALIDQAFTGDLNSRPAKKPQGGVLDAVKRGVVGVATGLYQQGADVANAITAGGAEQALHQADVYNRATGKKTKPLLTDPLRNKLEATQRKGQRPAAEAIIGMHPIGAMALGAMGVKDALSTRNKGESLTDWAYRRPDAVLGAVLGGAAIAGPALHIAHGRLKAAGKVREAARLEQAAQEQARIERGDPGPQSLKRNWMPTKGGIIRDTQGNVGRVTHKGTYNGEPAFIARDASGADFIVPESQSAKAHPDLVQEYNRKLKAANRPAPVPTKTDVRNLPPQVLAQLPDELKAAYGVKPEKTPVPKKGQIKQLPPEVLNSLPPETQKQLGVEWRAAEARQPQLAPNEVALNVDGERRTATLTPEQMDQWNAEKARHADNLEGIKRTVGAQGHSPDKDLFNRQMKGAAMSHTARLREISGLLTEREAAAAEKQANALTAGKPVFVKQPDGTEARGTLVSNPTYGKVKVSVEGAGEQTHPTGNVRVNRTPDVELERVAIPEIPDQPIDLGEHAPSGPSNMAFEGKSYNLPREAIDEIDRVSQAAQEQIQALGNNPKALMAGSKRILEERNQNIRDIINRHTPIEQTIPEQPLQASGTGIMAGVPEAAPMETVAPKPNRPRKPKAAPIAGGDFAEPPLQNTPETAVAPEQVAQTATPEPQAAPVEPPPVPPVETAAPAPPAPGEGSVGANWTPETLFAKLALDPTGEKRVFDLLDKSGVSRQRVTMEEQQAAARKVADALRLDRNTLTDGELSVNRKGVARMGGAEALGRLNVVKENVEAMNQLTKTYRDETLPFEARQQAFDLINALHEQSNHLLKDVVTAGSATGRDLGVYRLMANMADSPETLFVHATRLLGDRPLTDEIRNSLTAIYNKLQEACQ